MAAANIASVTQAYLNDETHVNTSGNISDAWWARMRALTDQSWGCAPGHAAQHLSAHGFQVHQYYFVAVGPYPSPLSLAGPGGAVFAVHASDLAYDFGVTGLFGGTSE